MKLKPLKEKISITIDNDILAKLKEKAEYDDRSLSQYINIVLKQHIKDLEDAKKPWLWAAPIGSVSTKSTYVGYIAF